MRDFLVLIACATLGACVSGSPYARPISGTLTGAPIYSYGQFCGPGVPANPHPRDRADLRIAYLRSIEPINYIDFVCQRHDVCYEEIYHDAAYCDVELGYALGHSDFYPPDFATQSSTLDDYESAVGCKQLMLEIVSGIQQKRPIFLPDGTRGERDDGAFRNLLDNALQAQRTGIPYAPEMEGVCEPHNRDEIVAGLNRLRELHRWEAYYGWTPSTVLDNLWETSVRLPLNTSPIKQHPGHTARCNAAIAAYEEALERAFTPFREVVRRWPQYAETDAIRHYIETNDLPRIYEHDPETGALRHTRAYEQLPFHHKGNLDVNRYRVGDDTATIIKEFQAAAAVFESNLDARIHTEDGALAEAFEACDYDARINELYAERSEQR